MAAVLAGHQPKDDQSGVKQFQRRYLVSISVIVLVSSVESLVVTERSLFPPLVNFQYLHCSHSLSHASLAVACTCTYTCVYRVCEDDGFM